MGIAYYYFYEGKGNKPMSQTWFEIAAESSNLEANRVECAKRLAKIAGYYANLDSEDKSGFGTTSYLDYWNDLTELVNGNLVETVNVETACVMYNELVSQISQNNLKFKATGITKEQMLNELDNIRARLENDVSGGSDSIEKSKTDILNNIDLAEKQVRIAYSNKESNLTERTGGVDNAGTGTDD